MTFLKHSYIFTEYFSFSQNRPLSSDVFKTQKFHNNFFIRRLAIIKKCQNVNERFLQLLEINKLRTNTYVCIFLGPLESSSLELRDTITWYTEKLRFWRFTWLGTWWFPVNVVNENQIVSKCWFEILVLSLFQKFISRRFISNRLYILWEFYVVNFQTNCLFWRMDQLCHILYEFK